MVARISAKVLTISGLCLVASGILMSYLLDIVSFRSTDTWLFESLGPASLLALLIGIITLFVGCIGLTRQISPQSSFAIGILCFLAWPLGAILVELGVLTINVHDWSAILLFFALALVPFGFVFVIGGSRKR